MGLPVIVISGEAGSGKDTVGEIISRRYLAQTIAIADPLKRIVQNLFGFSDEQLWGASDERDKVDERLNDSRFWEEVVFPNVLRIDPSHHKGIMEVVLNLRDEGANTPRRTVQYLGTEWGRNYDPTMWIRVALQEVRFLLQGGHRYTPQMGSVPSRNKNVGMVVVTDARFRDEVAAFKEMGAAIVRLTTPNNKTVADHRSEKELNTIPMYWYDYLLENKKESLAALEKVVVNMVDDYLGKTRKVFK